VAGGILFGRSHIHDDGTPDVGHRQLRK
jgi:hypothetical protein